MEPAGKAAKMDALIEQLRVLTEALERNTERTRELERAAEPEPEVPLPERFSGTRASYTSFKLDLQLLFDLKPRTYSREEVKIKATVVLLTGRAKSWAHRLLQAKDPALDTWDAFVTALDTWVGRSSAPAEVRTPAVSRKPRRPPEERLLNTRVPGVFPDHACHPSHPVEYPEERHRNTRVPGVIPGHTNRPLFPEVYPEEPSPMTAPEVTVDEEEPMVLGYVRPAPVHSEQDRRRHLGLCFYCGHGGHYITYCPVRPPRKTPASHRACCAAVVARSRTGRLVRARSCPCFRSGGAFPVQACGTARTPCEPLLPNGTTEVLPPAPCSKTPAPLSVNPEPKPEALPSVMPGSAPEEPIPSSVTVPFDGVGDSEEDVPLFLESDEELYEEGFVLPYVIASNGMPVQPEDLEAYEAELCRKGKKKSKGKRK